MSTYQLYAAVAEARNATEDYLSALETVRLRLLAADEGGAARALMGVFERYKASADRFDELAEVTMSIVKEVA
ncbi:MAG: hypothetical protein LBE62_03095 [Azonexus sp.]|jgi:hypothetical protein|nr:hypothetical protein [Azonexus sp.]